MTTVSPPRAVAETPLPIAAIDEALRMLLKALRAVQLYPANNTTRQIGRAHV